MSFDQKDMTEWEPVAEISSEKADSVNANQPDLCAFCLFKDARRHISSCCFESR